MTGVVRLFAVWRPVVVVVVVVVVVAVAVAVAVAVVVVVVVVVFVVVAVVVVVVAVVFCGHLKVGFENDDLISFRPRYRCLKGECFGKLGRECQE
jgi:hypothetical protein